jgi:hypothetical protein
LWLLPVLLRLVIFFIVFIFLIVLVKVAGVDKTIRSLVVNICSCLGN